MATATATQSYNYASASAMTDAGVLALQTSGGVARGTSSIAAAPATAPQPTTGAGPSTATAHPRFFSGFLAEAEPAAAGLLGLANVAAAHYYRKVPTWMRDPVVTCDAERLRFESFSACCGVYARLDVLPDAIDGQHLARGTTNVDVNNPLRLALGRVRGADPLQLEVGPDELAVTTFDGTAVERKVPLPGRWLRGFAEVQALTSGFEPRATLAAPDAARFLRSLPTTGRAALWAVPAGRSLRLTSRPAPGAVSLPEPARLKELVALLRYGAALTVYGPALTANAQPVSSCWALALPGMRFTLTLSPQAARGFSGEGAVLAALAEDEAAEDAAAVGELLDFQGRIDPDELAERTGLDRDRIRAALSLLGTSGRVGFDPAEAAFFHRELPYDAARALKDNPRLAAAYALYDAGAVQADGANRLVRSQGGSHLVRFVSQEPDAAAISCTCFWWAKYQGGRGPCKHILAAQVHRRHADEPEED
jgi:SWIM zinc finger